MYDCTVHDGFSPCIYCLYIYTASHLSNRSIYHICNYIHHIYTIIFIGYISEVQITVTTHACDGLKDPTVAAVNAASYALLVSKQPWFGPIGCVRVGYIDGKYALLNE
jgi:ribonuclease PH